MRRLSCLVALTFLALLVVMPSAGAQQNQEMMGQPTPKTWSVAIEDFYFEPADAAIQPGDTIMWTNEGSSPHTVTSDDGQFDSGVLNPGDTFSVTFTGGDGTLTYHCKIHPSMTGSVSGGGGGGGSALMEQPAAPAGGDMSMPMMGGY
jgi:plastocyanin